ncbi:MAG: glycosyltransferase family 4 protein [Gracilimonas sp.]
MNIIQVCPYDLSIPGGVQTHIAYLSNQLVKKKHNVLIIAPSLKNSGAEIKFNGEVLHITNSRRIKLWGTSIDVSILGKKEKQKFREILNDFAPDVIHFHTIWNPLMQTQLLWMAKDKTKCVATFHDTPPDFGIGKHVGGNLMKLAARYYLPRLDEIISVSESQAQAMGVDSKAAPPNFRVLPNGIDTSIKEKYCRPGKDDGDKTFNLIFIGRLEKRKGLEDLLEVYRRLKNEAEVNHKKISLSVLGDGPLSETAQKYVAEHKLEDITFYPDTSDEEKFELLADSDLLVAPSLYGESFGIVLLEAMALGIKVAGYGNSGYLNIGREYGVENFPEPGDKNALFNVIKNHIMNPDTTEHLIKKGFDIANKHDWKVITHEIENIYQRQS